MKQQTFNTIAISVIVGALMAANAAFQYGTVDTYTATVTDKERVTSGSGSEIKSTYMIFTDDRTFENEDSLWHWKWDSSDVYGSVEVGQTYRITAYGWRVPLFSMYENIVSVEPTQTTPSE